MASERYHPPKGFRVVSEDEKTIHIAPVSLTRRAFLKIFTSGLVVEAVDWGIFGGAFTRRAIRELQKTPNPKMGNQIVVAQSHATEVPAEDQIAGDELDLGASEDDMRLAVASRDEMILKSGLRETVAQNIRSIEGVEWDSTGPEALDAVLIKTPFFPPFSNGYIRRDKNDRLAANQRFGPSEHNVHGFKPGGYPLNRWDKIWYGSDYQGIANKSIHAAFSGTVVAKALEGRFGWYVDIASPNGVWRVRYHHLDEIQVAKGQPIAANQILAREGYSAAHIHTIAEFNYHQGPERSTLVPLEAIVAEKPVRGYQVNYQEGSVLPESYDIFVRIRQLRQAGLIK